MRTSAWSRGTIEIEDGKILRVGKDLPRKEEDLAVDCAGSYTVVPALWMCTSTAAPARTPATPPGGPGGHGGFPAGPRGDFLLPHYHDHQPGDHPGGAAGRQGYDGPPHGGGRPGGGREHGRSLHRQGAQRRQKEEDILPPDFPLFQRFYEESGGIVRLVDVAPEQPGGLDFVEKASQLCTVSIAHTTADYDQAKAAFDKGVTHATHLFNAMSGLHHRKPGVVGAVFDDSRVRGELICDGFHIHPAVLRAAFRLLGDRALIVSDSMRANGMPEGEAFDLGGQMVTVHQGKALLPDGTIAGSVTNLHQEIKTWFPSACPLSRPSRQPRCFPPGHWPGWGNRQHCPGQALRPGGAG